MAENVRAVVTSAEADALRDLSISLRETRRWLEFLRSGGAVEAVAHVGHPGQISSVLWLQRNSPIGDQLRAVGPPAAGVSSVSQEIEKARGQILHCLQEAVEAYEQRLEAILVQFMAGLGKQEG